MITLMEVSMHGVELLSTLFVFVVGLGVLGAVLLYIYDVTQSRDAVLHNYPVVGHFRYIFTRLGEFFRQYFFALDREEMPFNRAEREWVYKSAAGRDNNAPFGSTRNITTVGTPIFVNCAFPELEENTYDPPPVTFGPDTAHPYISTKLINISGMSYGALSRPAIQALSRGAALAGCWLNTGEGGLSKFHLEGECDIVFQIGTAKYGVRDAQGRLDHKKLAELAAIEHVRMFEVKLSQGAKPGKGGILPAMKVTREIAKARGIPVHQASISPNRHVEIDSIGSLLDFIAMVRSVTGKPTGVKFALGAYGWFRDLCAEIIERGMDAAPDFVSVDSGDGGTGAAPMALMDTVALPIREALPCIIDILTEFGLRDRVKVIAAGKLINPAEIAWAYCAGADTVVSARGFMFSAGCIQAMRCHTNNCPTGITTHKRRLQAGLDPRKKAVSVKNYVEKVGQGVGIIAHSCGVPHARALKRKHVRIVQANGRSVPLEEIYPPRPHANGMDASTYR